MRNTLVGAQTSFKDIFDDEVLAPVLPIKKVQGRDEDLNRLRNECLLHRYYWICRKNGPEYTYKAAIRDTASLFFLSPFYTSKVVLNNNELLIQIKQKWKGETTEKMSKDFARRWPQLVWSL